MVADRKSLIPVQVKWDEVGSTVEGRLMDKEETLYAGNTRGRYLIETQDGMRVFMGGFILDQALKIVSIGALIGVKYLGEEGTGRGSNKLKLFEIWELVERNAALSDGTLEVDHSNESHTKK